MYILDLLDDERRPCSWAAAALLRLWMMDHSEELAATGTEISRLLSAPPRTRP